jgi:hypothetical protein
MKGKRVVVGNVVTIQKPLIVDGVNLTSIAHLNLTNEELKIAAEERKKQFSGHIYNMLIAGGVFKTDANLAKLTGVLEQTELLEVKRIADMLDNFYRRRLITLKARSKETAERVEERIEGGLVNQVSAMTIMTNLNILDDDMLCDFLEDLSKLIFKYNKKQDAFVKKQAKSNEEKIKNDKRRIHKEVSTIKETI